MTSKPMPNLQDDALPTPEAGQFAWLIEAPGRYYLGARKVGVHEFYWTADHDKALRFHTEEQGDLTMMAVRALKPDLFAFALNLSDARVTEHKWMGGADE